MYYIGGGECNRMNGGCYLGVSGMRAMLSEHVRCSGCGGRVEGERSRVVVESGGWMTGTQGGVCWSRGSTRGAA